ncbi:MAG: HPP family protein [Desulfatirhabdiaceae bacterium]
MKRTARDVMVTEFNTIQYTEPITEAVKLIYHADARETGYKTISVMVTNHFGDLVGVVSMFDILYHLRPPILNYLGDNIHLGEQELESYGKRFKEMTVEEVMNSPVKYVSPDTDIMGIVDRMVKDKCRRLPVVEGSKVIGIVYLSEIFLHLCANWLDIDL